MTEILAGVVEEGERLLRVAREAGVPLWLLGGVAIRVRAPAVPPSLDREYKDLDFAIDRRRNADAERLLREAGYEPQVRFNAMNDRERMLFFDNDHGRQVDVFVGSFRMCHEIPFGDRLAAGQPTVPLAELLLTKLQIIELNEKDVRDTLLLLHGHEVDDGDGDGDAVSGTRIARLCAGDWGLWRTITHNLAGCVEHLVDYDLGADERERIGARVRALLARIETEPKSRGWKWRAKVGERKRWYELPEEVAR